MSSNLVNFAVHLFNHSTAVLKSIALLIFIALSFMKFEPLHAQSKIDSLGTRLKESTNDSIRLNLLVELSSEYQFVDISKGLKLAEEAIGIGEKKDWAWGKAMAYRNKAKLEGIKGDYASAIKFNDLALIFYVPLKDSSSIAICYNNLGTNYYGLGKFDEAYFYHTQSYRIANESGDKLQRAISLHNIASVFKELGQYDRAVDYLKLSLKLSNEANDHEGKPYYYSEMGDIYIRKKQYDSALAALSLSLKYVRQGTLSTNELEPKLLYHIAKTYLSKNDKPNAIKYYDSASMSYTKSDNKVGNAEVDLGRGLVLLNEDKYNEAQILIEKSATVAHQLNAWTLEIECYKNLSRLFENKGDLKKSLFFFKQFHQLEDSLFSQGMLAKLLQNEIRFEINSKEEQIKILTQLDQQRKEEDKKQEMVRNILAVTVALALIVLFTVYRSGQRRIKINKLLLEHQDDIKKRSIELEQLNQVKDKFFSIISHDLRSPMNALSGILDLMAKDQITPAEFSVLNKELRIQFNHTKTLINNLLDWTLLQMDKLKIQTERIDLSALVDANIKLLSSMHFKEVKISSYVSTNSFALGDTNMINLVLRNLITNAIKFSESGDLIEINAKDSGDSYTLSIKDNGVGISPEIQKILFEKTSGYSTRGTANEKGTGLGLILCKEFVERNGGKIWLESELGKGSTFFFTVKKA